VQVILGIKQDLVSKITNTERAGGVAQVAVHLHSKCIGPEFNPQYYQKRI
jgi:hypothetical protein